MLDRKPFSFIKLYKKGATHLVWIIISLITGFGFTLYFNDAIELTKALAQGELSYNVAGWILGIAGMTYIMAGFAREQVCNYMCPYARFQSVMFDRDTLIISYDEKRGEPRGKMKKGNKLEGNGDCISCNQCVVVCPANIDIRDGLQMECIACGMCIDACDEVMDKVNLPKGLIRYDTLHNLENLDKSKDYSFKILRPRTFYYCAILLIVGGWMLYSLSSRPNAQLNIIADRNPMFVTMSDGSIRNGYTIKIANKTHQQKTYSVTVEGVEEYKLKAQGVSGISADNLPVTADNVGSFKLYLTINPDQLNQQGRKNDINFIITDNETGEVTKHKAVFIN